MQPLFAEFTSEFVADRWQVCLADRYDYLGFGELAELLYSEHLRLLEQTDILVIRLRVDVSVSTETLASLDLAPLIQRVPRSSLHLLFSNNFEIILSDNRNGAVGDRLKDGQLRSEFLTGCRTKNSTSSSRVRTRSSRRGRTLSIGHHRNAMSTCFFGSGMCKGAVRYWTPSFFGCSLF